jgi:hypothetical protein
MTAVLMLGACGDDDGGSGDAGAPPQVGDCTTAPPGDLGSVPDTYQVVDCGDPEAKSRIVAKLPEGAGAVDCGEGRGFFTTEDDKFCLGRK